MTCEIFHSELTGILKGEYEKEIHDWGIIKQILSHIVTNNYQGFGCNIVDFIDRGNWDRISKIDFKDENRLLEMTWNDGWLYHASVESVFIIEHESAFFVLIKAYYQDKKMINRLYSTRCRSFEIGNFGDYMLEVERVTRTGDEFIQIPNINCYTTTIMIRPPSGSPVSNRTSELLMHEVNLMLAINKFASLLVELNTINEYDRDTLQEKGNTARRYLEYVLMLVNLRSENKFEKDYQVLMLGSLTGVIEFLGLPDKLKNEITLSQELLNACSHHGGIRIEKNKLISAIRTLHQLCHWVKEIDFFKISEQIRSKSVIDKAPF
ncbi:hypothetical protein LVQ78_11175 [Buttiauxella sp. A2-C2_NF]|jgi:hypothetical protein|uniref:hypothetical protein n=1 Tax=Buttiauxella ferragutiae TaxID=82989 RepID=UPI001E3C9D3D|nr:hypothetical protein [Buttiauxella ferragutiae]MCE0826591.1 hypothetical protein [Buttiauxella ferragutiae]